MCGPNEESEDETWEYFDKVSDALNGLFEVLNIALDPKSVYYQCGVDNLKALKSSLIDLLMKDYDTLDLQDTLRRIEFNVKKSLFFKDTEESEEPGKEDEGEVV
ncbi:MAG: hypothetical protein ACXABO_11670 [Promethearchaeota archaeon]|jgi:hypothetical protein